MNNNTADLRGSTPPHTMHAKTPVISADWPDTVWYVAIGIPGCIDWNLMGTYETRSEAAQAAAQEISEYWEILGAKPKFIPPIPDDVEITDSPDFNPDLYDPEKAAFWDDDDMWGQADPMQMLVYVANGGNVVGYVEMCSADRGTELYDQVTGGDIY